MLLEHMLWLTATACMSSLVHASRYANTRLSQQLARMHACMHASKYASVPLDGCQKWPAGRLDQQAFLYSRQATLAGMQSAVPS